MKRFYTVIAALVLGISSIAAQTMTLKIEGKEVKNGETVVVKKTVADMKTVVIPNILTKYDLHADVELTTSIAQTILLSGEDLEKDAANHLACCPAPFTCQTATAENNFISTCEMKDLTAGQVVKGQTFIHYAYKDNVEPNPADFERNCKLTLKGASETMVVNVKFVVGNPSGVNEVTIDNTLNGAAYNLAGQRVGAGAKGIVIRNGKKVLVK